MTPRIALLFLLAVNSAGCLAAEPAKTYDRIDFVESNTAGTVVRKLSVALTDNPAQACISGTWKQARVISDSGGAPLDPMYKTDGAKIEMLLVGNICDAYDSYVGTLDKDRFTGSRAQYGLNFFQKLGNVSGTYHRNADSGTTKP
jgi:hypothetical protein